MFLIPSETDSNLKVYHISSAQFFVNIFEAIANSFSFFCEKSEKMGVKTDQVGKNPMNPPAYWNLFLHIISFQVARKHQEIFPPLSYVNSD